MKFAVILAGVLLASPALAYEPTASEKAACLPEAFKHCFAKAIFGDRNAVIGCLILNKQKLGKPCRDVLTAHGL
jgi:hypothetical protein